MFSVCVSLRFHAGLFIKISYQYSKRSFACFSGFIEGITQGVFRVSFGMFVGFHRRFHLQFPWGLFRISFTIPEGFMQRFFIRISFHASKSSSNFFVFLFRVSCRVSLRCHVGFGLSYGFWFQVIFFGMSLRVL